MGNYSQKEKDPNYGKLYDQIINEFGLLEDSEEYKLIAKKLKRPTACPKGNSIFMDNNKKLIILENFEDHLTIIYKITSKHLKDALVTVNNILSIFEKITPFNFHHDYGYITVNSEYVGSGVSFSCIINEEPSGIWKSNKMEIEKEYLFLFLNDLNY